MSESARDPYVGINQHISQRANKEQHPTYTIGRILSLDPIKIRADGIDLEKEDLRVAPRALVPAAENRLSWISVSTYAGQVLRIVQA